MSDKIKTHKFCPKCKSEVIIDGAKFCIECGFPLIIPDKDNHQFEEASEETSSKDSSSFSESAMLHQAVEESEKLHSEDNANGLQTPIVDSPSQDLKIIDLEESSNVNGKTTGSSARSMSKKKNQKSFPLGLSEEILQDDCYSRNSISVGHYCEGLILCSTGKTSVNTNNSSTTNTDPKAIKIPDNNFSSAHEKGRVRVK